MVKHLVNSPTNDQVIMAITGMGGCGKTQLVSYFIREHGSLYTHVVYLDASSGESIKNDLETWIQSIGGHEEGTWSDALLFLQSGPHNGRWLLILDNADDVKVKLVPFFPDCRHGTILITSRHRDREKLSTNSNVELGVMNDEEAMSTLLLSAKRQAPLSEEEHASAQNLLSEIGHLPLAINLAGTYCQGLSSHAQQPYTIFQYLEAFRSKRSHLMDRQQADPLDQYEASVNATVSISYSHLSDGEKDAFLLFSLFDGVDISLEIFSTAAKRKFEDQKVWLKRPAEYLRTLKCLRHLFLSEGEWDSVRVEEMISNLSSISLLNVTSTEGTIHLHFHPLVQSWARSICDKEETTPYYLMATQVITACEGEDGDVLTRTLLSHVQVLRTSKRFSGLHINSRMSIARCLQDMGYYDAAAEYYQNSWEELREKLGSEDPVVIKAMSMLGITLHSQGKYAKAEKIQLEVWGQWKKQLGADHPDTFKAASNLAVMYGELGRHQEAEILQLEVWEQRKRLFGAEHPDTIRAACNLAATYGELGHLEEAEKLQLEAWEQTKRRLGANHLDTISVAGNLALIYGEMGHYQEAEKILVDAWEQRKKQLGADHPSTIRAAVRVAAIYRELGRHHEAEMLQVEVWEQGKRLLGIDHRDTISAASNLALIYGKMGRHQEASTLQLEVWEQRKRLLGAHHPITLRAASRLAITYGELGRRHRAEGLQLQPHNNLHEANHSDRFSASVNPAHIWGTETPSRGEKQPNIGWGVNEEMASSRPSHYYSRSWQARSHVQGATTSSYSGNASIGGGVVAEETA